VELLLSHGADPGVANNHDVSPLSLAIRMAGEDDGLVDLVRVLEAATQSPPDGDRAESA
jgi:hypothetical protein